jgi:hypothetical protein
MATLGEATISGVPPFGLPKIKSFVEGIFSPTLSASPLSREREQRAETGHNHH